MARTNFVKKARKDQGNCAVCGKAIKAGMPYKAENEELKKTGDICLRLATTRKVEIENKEQEIFDLKVQLSTARAETAKEIRPVIVCLCGSTRFSEAWIKAFLDETLDGKIVLTVGNDWRDKRQWQDIDPVKKVMLDELHKRKIDLADEVLILNVGGYIGESTRSELNYAKEHGKIIRYLAPLDEGGTK